MLHLTFNCCGKGLFECSTFIYVGTNKIKLSNMAIFQNIKMLSEE